MRSGNFTRVEDAIDRSIVLFREILRDRGIAPNGLNERFRKEVMTHIIRYLSDEEVLKTVPIIKEFMEAKGDKEQKRRGILPPPRRVRTTRRQKNTPR